MESLDMDGNNGRKILRKVKPMFRAPEDVMETY